MWQQREHFYEFGPFRLDVTERTLLRNGQPVPLTPKAFETLLVLVQNGGHLLEKDELLKAVWPDTFVEEATLAKNVFTLRKVLGDTPDGHQYIETVPRRGYRFIASVTNSRLGGAQSGSLGREDALDAGIPHKAAAPGWWKLAGASGLVLIVLSVYALYKLRSQLKTRAVAPFLNMRISRLTNTGKSFMAAVSPDGEYLIHVVEEAGRQSLWLRQLASPRDIQIAPPAETSFQGLTFSRDGNWVYCVRDYTLYQVPLLGDVSRELLKDVDSPITFSPDGKKLAFVRENVSRGESAVVTANADGTGEMKLSTRKLPNYFGSIAWSPEGTVLACSVGNRTGTTFMTVVEVAVGNGQERPLTLRKWYEVGQVAWLHDASSIVATAREQPRGPSQLWRISYPSGEAQRITNDLSDYDGASLTTDSRMMVTVQETRSSGIWISPNGTSSRAKPITTGAGQDGRPSWTPDGKVVFESRAGENLGIWIMDSDGGNKKQLTVDSHTNASPCVSPNGPTIVFVSYRANTTNIWRMDIDGRNPKQLTRGVVDEDPDCSPDGRWVIYTNLDLGKPTLWKVPLAGGAPVQITDSFSRYPVVSPDGKLIASYYWDEQPDSPLQVVLFPFPGGKPTKGFTIPPGVVRQAILRWTSNGQGLVYVASRDRVSNLWSQPLDGSPPRQLTDFQADRIFGFDWSRDGRWLACSRGSVAHDVVLISGFK